MNVIRFMRLLKYNSSYWFGCIATAAIAIASVAILYALLDALWLQRLAVDGRVVAIVSSETDGTDESESFMFAPAGLRLFRGRTAEVFDAVAGQVPTVGAQSDYRVAIVLGNSGPPIEALAVTPEYFATLGIPVVGPGFSPGVAPSAAPIEVVVSEHLWQARLARSKEAIGGVFAAEPADVRVVGIASAGFRGARLGERYDIWILSDVVPLLTQGRSRGAAPLLPLARLRPGVSLQRAQEVVASLPRSLPLTVVPMLDVFGSDLDSTRVAGVRTLAGLVGISAGAVAVAGAGTLFLLVAVAGLRRRSEMLVRWSLGASAARLLVWPAIETAVLGSLGVMLSAVLASAAMAALARIDLPGGLDAARLDLRLDYRVVCLGGAVVMVAMILGHSPLLSSVRGWMRGHGTGTSGGADRQASQALTRAMYLHGAVTVVCLTISAVAAAAVVRAWTWEPGFRPAGTLFIDVQVRPSLRQADEQTRDDHLAGSLRAALVQIRDIPGVSDVAVGPRPVGRPGAAAWERPRMIDSQGIKRPLGIRIREVGANYLRLIGVSSIEGRLLNERDSPHSHPVPAVISQTLSRTFPGGGLGKTFRVSGVPMDLVVVGVIADVGEPSAQSASTGILFLPTDVSTEVRKLSVQLAVVAHGFPSMIEQELEKTLRAIFPGVSRFDVKWGAELLADHSASEKIAAAYFGLFGIVVFALGTASCYSLATLRCTARQRDLAIHVALGAEPRRVVIQEAWHTTRPVLLGAVVGGILSVFALQAGMVRLGHVAPHVAAAFGVIVLVAGTTMFSSLKAAVPLLYQGIDRLLRSE